MEENLIINSKEKQILNGPSFPKEKVVGGARKIYIHSTFLGFKKMEVHQNNKKCSPFQREKEVGGKE